MDLKYFGYAAIVVSLTVVFVAAFIWIGGLAYADTGTTVESSTNESLTVDYGNWTRVAQGDTIFAFYDNETVRNSAGDELTEGQDYEWNPDNASIIFIDTPQTTEGEDASITYWYDAAVPTAQTGVGLFQILIGLLPYIILVALGFAMIVLGWVIYRFARNADRTLTGGRGGFT